MLILGCGRLGGIFARIWREREPDDALVCTVRRPESRDRLDGFDVRVLDLLDREAVRLAVAGHQRILVSVVGDDAWSVGIPKLARELDPSVHVVHISSTGVYAEQDGGEIDEESPVPGDSALAVAEEAFSALRPTIFRCSGLVAPDRGPHRVLDRIAGTSRPDGWLSLVRMDEVAELIAVAFTRDIHGTFNVSGSSMLRSEFYDPLLAAAGLEPVQWGSGVAGRRVRCARLAESFELRPNPVDPAELVPFL